jgi:hypothetical protein
MHDLYLRRVACNTTSQRGNLVSGCRLWDWYNLGNGVDDDTAMAH